MKIKTLISKQKNHAFGKDIYLLGADKEGVNYWLEAPKWDCGWYWGFGYVETYTNNKHPETSRDIEGHSHIDSSFMGTQEVYNHEKGCFVKGEYIHNIFDSPTLETPTFTEKEGWQLSELFKEFYLLREFAEFSGKTLPGCHITSSPVNHGDLTAWCNKVNKEMIPLVTAKIIEILTPIN